MNDHSAMRSIFTKCACGHHDYNHATAERGGRCHGGDTIRPGNDKPCGCAFFTEVK